MISKIAILIVVFGGFLYGKKYSRINDYSNWPFDIYIISIKWWNIEFNLYLHFLKWKADLKIRCLVRVKPIRYREWCLIFSSAGIKFCTININKTYKNKKGENKRDEKRFD